MINAKIEYVGRYIPANRVTNDDLSKIMDTSDEWIRSRTGIGARYIATQEETTLFMIKEAAKKVLDKLNVDASTIDAVVVATITPDYPDCPSVANLLQDAIGASEACMAYDIKAACSGFVYALEQARALIQLGYKNILVAGGERLSQITDWEDRSSAVLFGDGAGVALIRPTEEPSNIVDSALFSRGKGALALPLVQKESTTFEGEKVKNRITIQIDGQSVYMFAVDVNNKAIQAVLDKTGLTIDDIKWIVPHQANERIIKATAKRSNIPMEKFFINIEKYANTSGATIPIALSEMLEQGLLERGDKIITVGFGGGLTYGANLIVW